jgi:hypothetical protein
MELGAAALTCGGPHKALPQLLGALPSRQLVAQDTPHQAELMPRPSGCTTVVLAGPCH